MQRTLFVLVLTALYVRLANSWDIAVGAGDQLEFYSNGTKTGTVNFSNQNITALVYDEVHNIMLYVDKQNNSDAICGYSLTSKEKKTFVKRSERNIHSLAFDPISQILFFTDTRQKSINWISLKSGFNNNQYGNILIKMDDRTPTDIVVDSCRGYIYWVNTEIDKNEHIERARFDGSEREVTYTRSFDIYSLTIDAQTQKMYYFEGAKFDQYILFLVNVDLKNAHFISINDVSIMTDFESVSASKVLAVSKNYIYWVNSTETFQNVWKLPKFFDIFEDETLEDISKFYIKTPLSIATNDKVAEHIQGLQDCQESPTPTNLEETNYISERCDVSPCENYCFKGYCSLNDKGLPICRCNAGYSGDRCEVYACHGYCLNNGDCSLNEEDEPVCECVDDHEGSRCEAVRSVIVSTTPSPSYDSAIKNLTLADLLSGWRKPASKMFVIVEI